MIKIRAIRYLLGAATACGNGDPKIPVTGFGPVHAWSGGGSRGDGLIRILRRGQISWDDYNLCKCTDAELDEIIKALDKDFDIELWQLTKELQ